MLQTSQTYEDLLRRIVELEERLARARQAEAELAELERLYASSLKDLDVRTREIYAIRSILNMPQLYFDDKLRIVGYSGDFLRLTTKVIDYARERKNLGVLFRRDDLDLIHEHLEQIRSLEDLPYDQGEKWQLRYEGPTSADQLGSDWLVYRQQEKNWSIIKKGSDYQIVHQPHIDEQLDCCLMSSREYGGPVEDVKLIYQTRTPANTNLICDLTMLISAGSGREELVPDVYGYTACLGSNYNTLGRIQKQSADVISRPESLEPDTVYRIEVERTGGRISRRVKNLDTGLTLPDLEYIDHNAIYDSPNHVGFYTYSGAAQFSDVRIYTRKSRFRIDQFRIPLECEVELKDPQLKGRIFEVKYVRTELMDNPLHVLIFNDVTKRRKSEEALRESEERYRRLFEEGRVARSITSRDGRFIDINPEMLALFGYTRDEIQRIDARDL
ncbi:MAG: PAS domain-containing protein, partial [Candidatus Glassbacteria bacterium]